MSITANQPTRDTNDETSDRAWLRRAVLACEGAEMKLAVLIDILKRHNCTAAGTEESLGGMDVLLVEQELKEIRRQLATAGRGEEVGDAA